MSEPASQIELPADVRALIPKKLLAGCEAAVSLTSRWCESLPRESAVYLNSDVPIRVPPRYGPRIGQRELNLADTFYDVHSMMTGLLLTKSWRAGQLAEGLRSGLQNWNLTSCALVTRALVESASSWWIEGGEVEATWKKQKALPMRRMEDALRVRQALVKATRQPSYGTRLPPHIQHPDLKRVNVLTFIKQTEQRLPRPGLMADYDVLCDAVHPSWGSNELFWREFGLNEELRQYRVLLQYHSPGHISTEDSLEIRPGSVLSRVILTESTWALSRLVADLVRFQGLCNDVCLTGGVHILSDRKYWGAVSPTGLYEPCACGSGEKTKFCRHLFGEPEG
jgi:hypothetical protein